MSTVKMQYSRDFKGHLASLFLNESIDLGKRYIFDIQRTSKEVYDRARRALFNAGMAVNGCGSPRDSYSHSPLRQIKVEREKRMCVGCRETHILKEKLQMLQDALTCALCCEQEINAAFCPCGHMFCCYNCASQLQVIIASLLYIYIYSIFNIHDNIKSKCDFLMLRNHHLYWPVKLMIKRTCTIRFT